MVSRHPAKFGGHSSDHMFLVVEGRVLHAFG